MQLVVPNALREQPLIVRLTQISKTLHLNELEIALWAILLDQYNWTEEGIDDYMFLLTVAYQSKVKKTKLMIGIL